NFFVIITAMDKINPFTNAPSSAPGQPSGQAPAQNQPPKPQEPKPKREFSIKPLIKALVMIIIGVVIAKLAFDSVVPMFNPPQKSAVKEAKPGSKRAAHRGAVPSKSKNAKGKQAETLSLSEQFAAAKIAAKPAPQQSGDQFVLNGIFLSEGDGMSSAIVNNKVVQVGDSVDGALVQSITIDGVELTKDNSPIKLRNR
ncbi:MAG: hypothetical protein WC547_06025, partial [Candidatus Omnitrophota bacterium]